MCGNLILPEAIDYVYFYMKLNLRNLLYVIGTFGSYHRMKVYARNARDNGYGGADFEDPEQVLQKMDWTDLLKKIAKDYCANAVTFAQGLDVKSLTGFLEEWKKRTNDLV